ncbi:hypothetical protein [Sphingomonas sp. SUN039]|uniref:hypothetical protein n=1 Tax=Sphingomonas sp. SUN039 TaxID=2937787 RepID=UPI00216414C6|nr:hypothetical protein [Sphingomonas sp. SUN039]UVO54984.1 hypothetical protein M0209_12915 [Sphingomonas sp. SUN039]
MNPTAPATLTPPDWWNRRSVLALCVLLALVPLVYPPIPPLVDLPGHMGRYAVQLDPAPFAQWFQFRWQLIGNLGVDLLIEPLGRLFGVELGTKLIVMAIPALAVAGLLWIAREVHGRVPPTAFFALPLMWGHPFVFGFVNFSLAMALALLSFALWLRMARTGVAKWRPFVFLPLACVVWTAHTFGWGLLGLLCFSAETIRQRDLGKGWIAAGVAAVFACLPMALPLVPMVLWRSTATDMTGDWFDWGTKSLWVLTTLRDRWQAFDLASLAVVIGLIFVALRNAALGWSRNLATSALVLLAVYVLLPRIIFGSAYADMRLTPYLIAIAIVAIRPKAETSPKFLATLAVIGLSFFAARIAGHTASMAIASTRYDRALAALDHLPEGARVAAFTRRTCGLEWSTNRLEHLSALAMVRRHAFSNDQWDVSGANLMLITKTDAPGFVVDPSQLTVPAPCKGAPWMTPDQALAKLPRAAFDYVWLIDPPRYDARLTAGMTPVWRDRADVLYRIER